jgi:hypothetical protein
MEETWRNKGKEASNRARKTIGVHSCIELVVSSLLGKDLQRWSTTFVALGTRRHRYCHPTSYRHSPARCLLFGSLFGSLHTAIRNCASFKSPRRKFRTRMLCAKGVLMILRDLCLRIVVQAEPIGCPNPRLLLLG